MPSTNLQRTMGTATNAKKGTLSFWAKLAKSNNSNEYMRFIHIGGTSNDFSFYIIGDSLLWYVDAGVNGYGDTGGRLLRDYSAYYHIVVAIDSTLSTGADRIKCWVNGELQSSTEFPQGLNITQNDDVFDSSHVCSIGATDSSNLAQAFAGILAHYHFIDGTTYDATTFGEYDANGVWKIKTEPSVTYGNNGFFLFKDDASVNDQSGNGNNFTLSGTLTKSEDNPSNVFAVCNKLVNTNSALSFSNGNTTITNSGQWLGTLGTLGITSGKYYWEFKSTGNFMTGVSQLNSSATETNELNTANLGYSGRFATGYEMINGGNLSNNNSVTTPYGTSHTNGDIGMVAFDADNGTLWLGKNGTWHNSATQSEIENGTTTNSAYTGLTNNNGYIPSFSTENSTLHLNFGNGYFGTTAVASAGTNASGNGIFEYDVPTGYTALCTKGLNGE